MTPLSVVAYIASPCLPGGPLLLDGILLAGLGSTMGATRADGWADATEVLRAAAAGALPLARVNTPHGWWWAASQATPEGPEAISHAHRRPAYDLVERWTPAATLNHSAGPDKALRVPLYSRPAWTTIRWTAVGDPARVAHLLARVPGVGQRTTHGWGWVDRWEVTAMPDGPRPEQYAMDLALRHLPVSAVEDDVLRRFLGQVRRHELPLRPPYHARAAAVTCWQIARPA